MVVTLFKKVWNWMTSWARPKEVCTQWTDRWTDGHADERMDGRADRQLDSVAHSELAGGLLAPGLKIVTLWQPRLI